ncbi:MAG: hypothetical protein VYB87_04045 [Acidobacteriota bacterium]|nr:hypothetical protein [Acidobacteriota bacterium]
MLGLTSEVVVVGTASASVVDTAGAVDVELPVVVGVDATVPSEIGLVVDTTETRVVPAGLSVGFVELAGWLSGTG